MCSNHSPFLPAVKVCYHAHSECFAGTCSVQEWCKVSTEKKRKQSFLTDKAKAKREKFFDQERAMLIQNQAKRNVQSTKLCRLSTNPLTKIAGTEVEKKWGVDSDIILYTKQRGNQGFSLNNKLSFASPKHFVSSPTI